MTLSVRRPRSGSGTGKGQNAESRTHGHLVVPQHLGPGLGDNRDVDVGTRSQVVEDTAPDRTCNQVDSFLALAMVSLVQFRSPCLILSTSTRMKKLRNDPLTFMFCLKALSKTAMAAKLPEPIVTYGSLSVEP